MKEKILQQLKPINIPIQNQIELLAQFLVENFEGEIGKGKSLNGEGAIEMAVRLLIELKELRTSIKTMKKTRNKKIKRIIEEDIKRLEKQLIWAGDTKAESGEEGAINSVLLQEISFKKSQLKEIKR